MCEGMNQRPGTRRDSGSANTTAYRCNIVARNQADVQVVGIGGLEFSLPPVGIVTLEYVEDIVLLDRQLILGVGYIVIKGHMDLEGKHICTEQT
jgi:hypothetical protein